MGGLEAYERIRTLGSEVSVIFMTGYRAEMARRRFVVEKGAVFGESPR
jgi:hypothetical protein